MPRKPQQMGPTLRRDRVGGLVRGPGRLMRMQAPPVA